MGSVGETQDRSLEDVDWALEAVSDLGSLTRRLAQYLATGVRVRAWLLAEARWYAEWADNAGLPRYVMLPWKKARDAHLRTEE